MIRESKFGKSRLVPVLPDTLAALDDYIATRDRLRPDRPRRGCSCRSRGTELIYPVVQQVFRKLCATGRHRARRATSAADPRSAPHLRGHRAHRLVSAPARTSKPGCRRCRPISATATRVPRTGICPPPPSCWPSPPASSNRSRCGGQPMSLIAPTLQSFFTDRLVKQRQVSARTIAVLPRLAATARHVRAPPHRQAAVHASTGPTSTPR